MQVALKEAKAGVSIGTKQREESIVRLEGEVKNLEKRCEQAEAALASASKLWEGGQEELADTITWLTEAVNSQKQQVQSQQEAAVTLTQQGNTAGGELAAALRVEFESKLHSVRDSLEAEKANLISANSISTADLSRVCGELEFEKMSSQELRTEKEGLVMELDKTREAFERQLEQVQSQMHILQEEVKTAMVKQKAQQMKGQCTALRCFQQITARMLHGVVGVCLKRWREHVLMENSAEAQIVVSRQAELEALAQVDSMQMELRAMKVPCTW